MRDVPQIPRPVAPRMRIAYVAFLPGQLHGVELRIRDRARAARALGSAEVEFIIVGVAEDPPDSLVRYVPYAAEFPKPAYVNAVLRRYSVLERCVDLRRFDRIIVRYAHADPSGPGFARRYPIITEHHGDELSEHRAKIRNGLSVFEKQMKRVRYAMEAKYGGEMLAECRGIIGVTDEIRDIEHRRSGCTTPAVTVSNGIDVEQVAPTAFRSFDGRVLDMMFVASLVNPAPPHWHGLDRLIAGMEAYTGPVSLRLHVVGPLHRSARRVFANSPCTVFQYGPRTGLALDTMMRDMNLGVSTLGLYRKNLSQACSLKTREYTARGLPFVMAYDDPDLHAVDPLTPFFQRFHNDDSPIDMERVIEFAESLNAHGGPKIVAPLMRQHALEHMDWSRKVRQMLDFVRET